MRPDGKFFCQVWQRFAVCENPALQSPCLLLVLMEKCSSGFCLASLAGGAIAVPPAQALAQLGLISWAPARGRSLSRFAAALSCVASSVYFGEVTDYKKNSCVLFQTSLWCLLPDGWLQKGILCHGLGQCMNEGQMVFGSCCCACLFVLPVLPLS